VTFHRYEDATTSVRHINHEDLHQVKAHQDIGIHWLPIVDFIRIYDSQKCPRLSHWCRERGLNPRPSDVSDTTMGLFARHTIAL
jgi:hypothetical protein